MRNRYEDMTSDEAFRRVLEMDRQGGSSSNYDPIFTPIFTAVFTGVGLSASTAAFAATVATAIATTSSSEGVHRK